MEKEFKLVTNKVFERDGLKYKIDIKGVNTETRFKDNPAMLDEHEKHIGFWDGLKIESDAILAKPNFDSDSFSQEIRSKVERNSKRGASVGLDYQEGYLDVDGTIVITKSELFEASIVSIPAIDNALSVNLNFTPNNVLTLNNGDKLNHTEYLKKINNNMTDTKKDAVEAKPEKKSELHLLNEKVETIAAEKVQLNLDLTEKTKSFEELTNEFKTLESKLNDSSVELNKLTDLVNTLKTEKLSILLKKAVDDGKITKEAIEDFKELSYDKAESILEKILPSEVSLTEQLQANKNKTNEKTYEWYLSNDKEALSKLSKENSTIYKQLESAYVSKLNK